MVDKSKITVNKVEQGDCKLKGLQDRGKVILSCASCGQQLLCLQLIGIKGDEASSVVTKVAVKCGMCNSYSNVEKVAGRFSPGAISDTMIFDVFSHEPGSPEADVLFKACRK